MNAPVHFDPVEDAYSLRVNAPKLADTLRAVAARRPRRGEHA